MIRHAIYCDQFLVTIRDNAGYVFLQFLFSRWLNHTGAAGNGKDDLHVNLRVGIRHYVGLHVAPNGALEKMNAGSL